MQKAGQKTNFFDELTGVRAIAAFLVFFHHHNMFYAQKYGSFLHDFVNEFHVGVTVFFVLSGFLICYRYYDNIEIRNKKWIVQYIQNRVARIYPMYFLITTLTFIILFLQSEHLLYDVKLYLANITFLRGFFQSVAFTGVGQGWSLTVEECFYFSAPVLFTLSRRVKLFIPFLVIFFIGVLLVLLFSGINYYGFFGNFKFMLSYTFFGRCFEFFVGISLALFYKKNQYRLKSATTYWTFAGIFWMAGCIALLVLVKGDQIFGVFTYRGIFINNILLPLGIAMLFWGLITEKTIIKRILSTKLFVLLGKSSYTFYLIHQGLIALFVFKFTDNVLVAFVLINILSIVLFKLIEEPSNKWLRSIRFHTHLSGIKRKVWNRSIAEKK